MANEKRRILLRNGLVFGAGALIGAPSLRVAQAAPTKTLTLYNGQHAKTTEALAEAFTKATGIAVDIRKGKSAQLASQIIEEGANSPADVFYSEESPPVAALAEKGLLARLDATTLKQVPKGYTGKGGTWTAVSARCRVIAFNRDMVKESELPKSVLDMATEAWKDRVGFVPTSGAFQEQIIAIKLLKGREAALNWLKGLKQYGRIYNGNKAAMKAVESGEIATALVNNYYWYSVADEVGADKMKSALYYTGDQDAGALITVSAAGVLKSSANLKLAKQFVAFLVSKQGQEALVKTVAEYPLVPGVKSPYDLKPFNKLNPPNVTPADLGDAADALTLRQEAGLA